MTLQLLEPRPKVAASHPDLYRRLHMILGDEGCVQEAHTQAAHLQDWLGHWQGRTALMACPADTAQAAAVMRVCHETHTPVVTQGGHTGWRGGATPDASGAQVILSTRRLNRIRLLDPINDTVVVEAGVRLSQLQQAACDAERLFPLRLASAALCTVGGNLATNAAGVDLPRHARLRDLTLGLEVVLPDGRVWNGLRSLRGDHSGLDVRQLMIGSEGTLGVITAAVLKLLPRPAATVSAWVASERIDALLQLLEAARRRCGERLTVFELMSQAAVSAVLDAMPALRAPLLGRHGCHALMELSDSVDSGLHGQLEALLDEALQSGLLSAATISAAPAQTQAFWRVRDGIWPALQGKPGLIMHELSVPAAALADFVGRADEAVRGLVPQAHVLHFGRVADGHLHYPLLLPEQLSDAACAECRGALTAALQRLVAQYGGSLQAASGVEPRHRSTQRGPHSAIEHEVMMHIKQVLDPNHLMNPGKLF